MVVLYIVLELGIVLTISASDLELYDQLNNCSGFVMWTSQSVQAAVVEVGFRQPSVL